MNYLKFSSKQQLNIVKIEKPREKIIIEYILFILPEKRKKSFSSSSSSSSSSFVINFSSTLALVYWNPIFFLNINLKKQNNNNKIA